MCTESRWSASCVVDSILWNAGWLLVRCLFIDKVFSTQRVQTRRCITWLSTLSALSVMCVYEVRDDNDCGVGINMNTWWWPASGALYSTVTAWIHHPGSSFFLVQEDFTEYPCIYTCHYGLWWLGDSFGYITIINSFPTMIRSYHPEYTRSRPISEVKLDWAGPVLWTEMTREAPVTNLLLGVLSILLFFISTAHEVQRRRGQKLPSLGPFIFSQLC